MAINRAEGELTQASILATPNRRTQLKQSWLRVPHMLYAQPASAFGTTVVLLFVAIAVLGPWIAPYSATEQIASAARQAPSLAHLFGADRLGRDVFSRVLLGARDLLGLAGLGSLLAVLLGTVVGLISGYHGGLLDEVLFRIFDSLLALPALLPTAQALPRLLTQSCGHAFLLALLTMDVRPFTLRNGRLLVSAKRVHLGCGHTSTRSGLGTAIKSSSAGRMLRGRPDGA